jgi:hypothetical protein
MTEQALRLRPDRTATAVALVALLGALPLALSSWLLAPVLLLPVGAFVWVLRAQVVATPDTLQVCNGLGTTRVRWQDVAGFQVRKRGAILLLLQGGGSRRLTAVDRRGLRRLMEVAGKDQV